MGNPFEFREAMKAAFAFSGKTVEQVQAEQRQRRAEESKPRNRKRAAAAAKVSAVPRQSEIDKMNALLAAGKPRPRTTSE